MKIDVFNLEGKKEKSIDLPEQFSENYEPILIKRAVLVIEANSRQPYGAMEEAGEGASSKLSRRRRNYKGTYGHGLSRVQRKIMWRRGTQFGWVGASAPGTVGGRRSHPPKSWRNWGLKINDKERRKAIRSALAGLVENKLLYVVDSRIEDISKTKDFNDLIGAMGLNDIERAKDAKARAGKGKTRARPHKVKQGPVIVVSKKCNLTKVVSGIRGFNVIDVSSLNAKLLTSGHERPRKSIWSEDAVEKLGKERLFLVK